ncbi:MAG: hypothetical protein NT069_35165 [Planctomycetota bacterium]|nr:hypothetical protein [Planctomycetota bacterium]
MGLLSDFFISEGTAVPNYNGGDGLDFADCVKSNDITPLQAAQLLAGIRDIPFGHSMIREFEFLTPEDADDWTMSVPGDMVTSLANLPTGRVVALVERFASETEVELGWSPEDILSFVLELQTLAKRCVASNKSMYLWCSL